MTAAAARAVRLTASGLLLVATFAAAPSTRPAPRARVATPAAKTTSPARTPLQVATQARVFEEGGNYASAAAELKTLRSIEGPDADVELMLALDEARIGQADSAWARLHSPLLSAALLDSVGSVRRTEYPFQREGMLVNGTFDGWYWYIARARAELALQRGEWREAVSMASRAAAARPLSGKEALLLAIAAGRAGDAQLGEAAAAWAAYLEPWLPEAHYLSGIWAWRGGRRAEANEQFRVASELDTTWRDPVLAMARLRIPGLPADSLPVRFLTGVRRCAMLTSPRRPKEEEFVQFDANPMLVFNPQPQPDDTLRAAMNLKKKTQVYLQVLVSEAGRPLLAELPWMTEAQVPAAVVHHVLEQVGTWRFIAARKFNKPQRSWASVEYVLQP